MIARGLLLSVFVVVQAFGQPPSSPVPSSYFGMHIHFTTTPWPTVAFGAQGKASGTQWPYIERTRGVFDWSMLDTFVNQANAHGVGFVETAKWVPPWAAADTSNCLPNHAFGATVCPGPVANMQDWIDFMTALVTRYKGRIAIYELWNEPSDPAGWTGTVAQLVAMCNAEHDVIRAIDPAAKIVGPPMQAYASAYLDSYFAAGGTTDVDAVTLHASPNSNNAVGEFVMGSVTTDIKTVMGKYGIDAKPLWDSEGDWGDNSAMPNDDLKSAFIARMYLLSWNTGTTRLYWYAWDDSQIGTLWGPVSGPLPPSVAYQQVYDWMVGATMSGPCSLNGSTDIYNAIYTCDFTRPGGYLARAVWNTMGTSTYSAPLAYQTFRDLIGNRALIMNHQVTIGRSPILLEVTACPF